MTDFRDVYQAVTDQILAALERGVRPWARSWNTETRSYEAIQLPRRSTGQLYRGVNVLLLWCAAEQAGYRNVHWFTFKQAQALGASVRKGEKATRVLFFDRITRESPDGEETTIPFARTYAVFNAEQITGLPEQFQTQSNSAAPEKPVPEMPAEAFFAAIGADVRRGPKPLYVPSRDYIEMPRIDDFVTPDAYVATLAHELVHWTGHPSRLDREFKRQGTDAYAVEELVAELGAAFLCGTLGVAAGEREDHAAYLSSYLRALREDKRLIVRVASAAQRAVDFLHERAGCGKDAAAA
jgi:antirestriction protein ArdC